MPKHMTPESVGTITKRLTETAEKVRTGCVMQNESADLMDEAAEVIEAAIGASAQLMLKLMLAGMSPPEQARPKQHFVELTKEDYRDYCKSRVEGFPNRPGTEFAVRAIRTANKSLGVGKVMDIPDGPDLLKHLQLVNSHVDDWATGYAEYFEKHCRRTVT